MGKKFPDVIKHLRLQSLTLSRIHSELDFQTTKVLVLKRLEWERRQYDGLDAQALVLLLGPRKSFCSKGQSTDVAVTAADIKRR